LIVRNELVHLGPLNVSWEDNNCMYWLQFELTSGCQQGLEKCVGRFVTFLVWRPVWICDKWQELEEKILVYARSYCS
jgi:hypothetical protein